MFILIHPEWDSGTSCYQVWDAKVGNDIKVSLIYIVIINDDAIKYSNQISECMKVRLKGKIIDVYI